jgi:gluconate 2-dehydrogenase gamma chain
VANQGHDRREALQMLALAAAASRFSGFSKWICAAQHSPEHATSTIANARPAVYQPQFFTAIEYTTLDQLTEMIIPADEHPGAREAGVSEFIDFMAANDPTIQQRFRSGLRWLDECAQKTNGSSFAKLSAEQQEKLLATLAYREHYQAGQEDGQKFFKLIRRYTVMGYYTTRIGFEALDFPGLRLYSESPACPHKDDPEHRHLPPPRY